VKSRLGVDMPFGGEHDKWGTHNHLLRLGEDEFLEVIAINPAAPKPANPRVFNLDLHGNKSPHLAHWVARTDDIDHMITQVAADVGESKSISRGSLSWRITVPDDGSMAFDGAFPSILEWPEKPYPGSSMQAADCQLVALELGHPEPDRLRDALLPHINDSRISIVASDQPRLVASIQTAHGLCTL